MKVLSMKKYLAASLLGFSLFCSGLAWSGVAVVVHPSNTNDMDREEVARIFLGKKKSFANGATAVPIDQSEGSAIRTSFVGEVLQKTDQQVKAYWAQLLFTGRGTPPKSVDSDAAVKKLIAENPALIGYIDSNEVDDSVRVVYSY